MFLFIKAAIAQPTKIKEFYIQKLSLSHSKFAKFCDLFGNFIENLPPHRQTGLTTPIN